MAFQITWFILWGVLWAAYFMLDGFDFGVGILYPFLTRNEGEKSAVRRAIGPVWDGNEVWLITAGGATFAAFPAAYASMFSYLYSALLIILFALIFRGVALEFRAKGESSAWRRGWDTAFFLGSLLSAFLFGVAFGNIFRGLPIDAQGYHGTLFSLLNPYGLWTGLFFVMMFLVHGALWLALKTEGDLGTRALRFVQTAWYFLLAAAVIFLGWTVFSTGLEENYLNRAFPGGRFFMSDQGLGRPGKDRQSLPCLLRDGRACHLHRDHRTVPEPDPFAARPRFQPDRFQRLFESLHA
jgi:cytochrome d ubiquinol oxidase subunit II